MQIKNMFKKEIDREINGVVKVGQKDDYVIKQELEEYVVTQELQGHFTTFFDSYEKSISKPTDKIGVWIQGFFGSGKSHFLKILSYLLDNNPVADKKPIDYFIEDNKIDNQETLLKMMNASNIPTDVILFNIDADSDISNKKNQDVLVKVFLKVFNRMLGYSTNPHVAELERMLERSGKYEDFKNEIKKISDKEWEVVKNEFKFSKDTVKNAIANTGAMTLENSSAWIESTKGEYQISNSEFVNLVNEYIESKGENYRLIFMVDEMGQYIGDNTSLMLNLQTITEELGNVCKGKAWIVVTSQQAIDSITKVEGNDFSKIQGRFDTRINLTSTNVDEVIKKRLLEKNEVGKSTLSLIYKQNETVIDNLIHFQNGPELKKFDDENSFIEVYPFIPYQFFILGKVLPAVRKHGSSGKHLSEGERSLLSLFKESAIKVMNNEDGALVPFHYFYDSLAQWLDHNNAIVVSRAYQNQLINPDGTDDNFIIDVLKILFLIKYVDEIEANVENITTLMISYISDKRLDIEKKVKDALKILENQMLIQRNGEIYIFLSDEEQEINNEIKSQPVTTTEIIREVSDILFQGVYTDDSIRPDNSGHYTFKFDRFLDANNYGTNRNKISLKVYTQMSGITTEEIIIQNGGGNEVAVVFASNEEFRDEMKSALQILSFLRSSSKDKYPKFAELENSINNQLKDHRNRASAHIKEAFKNAEVYHNSKLISNNKNNDEIVTNALLSAFDIVYEKFNYLDEYKNTDDIKNLLNDQPGQIGLQTSGNKNAVAEVKKYIKDLTMGNTRMGLNSIIEKFSDAPYGWNLTDIQWIIAKLFISGEISLVLNGEELSLINQDPREIFDYISKKNYLDKVQVAQKETIPDILIENAKSVSKELFDISITDTDSELVLKKFEENTDRFIQKLNNIKSTNYNRGVFYPGRSVIDEAISAITALSFERSQLKKYEKINKDKGNLLDISDKLDYIIGFFESEQRNYWDIAVRNTDLFETSKSYLVNNGIFEVYEKIKSITNNDRPFVYIKDLPELNQQFLGLYSDNLDRELEKVKESIAIEKRRSEEYIENIEDYELENLKKQLNDRIQRDYSELISKAEKENNIQKLKSYEVEANTISNNHNRLINTEIEKINKRNQEKSNDSNTNNTEVRETRVINKKMSQITPNLVWNISSKEDVDKYLNILKNSLLKELESNKDTIIQIEI